MFKDRWDSVERNRIQQNTKNFTLDISQEAEKRFTKKFTI